MNAHNTMTGRLLSPLAGDWSGRTRMRLMPDDPYTESAATAHVRLAARGNLATVAYTWTTEDTEQDGLLLLGDGEDPGTAVAVWCDSWHQSPQWMTCSGRIDEGRITLDGKYAGGDDVAGWRIRVDATAARTLRIAMDNVIPEADYQVVESTYTLA